MCNETCDSV